MHTESYELVQRFGRLSDEALVERCAAGNLTETAQAIADAEMSRRGLAVPEPDPGQFDPAALEGDYATLDRFLEPTTAHIVRSCLVAAGMPAAVADGNLVQTNLLWAIALGGTRVIVPASRLDEARAIYAAFNRGDFALSEREP